MGLDPSQRLQVLEQIVILRQSRGQFYRIVVAALRHPCNGLERRIRHGEETSATKNTNLDLLDLLVIRRRNTVQVCSNLSSKICRGDESTKNIPRKNIGIRGSVILDIVVRDVDVLKTKWQMCCRDGTNTPIGLATKHLLLVVGRWRIMLP